MNSISSKVIRLAVVICLQFCVPDQQLAAKTWLQKQSVPGLGRRAAVSFSINGKIYLGGGIDFKDFYEYDPSKNTWTKKSDLPGVATERSFGIGFSINGKGYVGLGFDGINTGNIKSDLWEYDPSNDTWRRRVSIPGGPKESAAVFTTGGKAYVVGGDNGTNPAADVFEYDPAQNTWSRKARFPAGGIVSPMTFDLGGLGYVCCGRDSAFNLSNAVYAYDPNKDTWTRVADFPGTPRQAGVGFSINGRGYCGLGGFFASTDVDLYSYDRAADKWSPEAAFTGTGRIFPVAAQAGTSVFLGTGYNNGADLNDFFEYTTSLAVHELPVSNIGGIYPIPCTDQLCIDKGVADYTAYTICDLQGKVLQSGYLEAHRIPTKMLPTGNYVLTLQFNKQRSITIFQKQ